MVSRTYDESYYEAMAYKHHHHEISGPQGNSYSYYQDSQALGSGEKSSSDRRLHRSLYPQVTSSSPLPHKQSYHSEVPSFFGEVESDRYYDRWSAAPQSTSQRDYYEEEEEEEYQRRMNELEEHRRAKEEEERRPIHRYEDARRQARARKELQERARKQEQAQEEAAVQARKAAIAEMSPSGTIPKAKFPHLLSTAHQRWDSGSAFLTKSVTTNKNTAAGPCTGSPVSSFKNPNEIGFRKGESDHCSEISKVSWDPPYTYCAASMHSERKPLHLCKSEEEDSSTRGMEKKQLPHHSISSSSSRKLPRHSLKGTTTSVCSGSEPSTCISLNYLYQYESSHDIRVGAFAEQTSDDGSYRYPLERKDSSRQRKLPPPVGLKRRGNDDDDDDDDDCRVGAFAQKPPQRMVTVEIQPGFSLPLRGSQETLEAVREGRVLNTCCLACCTNLVVKYDCDFVICPADHCRVVSPVEGGFGTMEFVGLGFRAS